MATKALKKRRVIRKVYLTFPTAKTREPIICDMYDRYRIRFNIRSASVNESVGLIAVELEGPQDKMEQAFDYFRKRGVKVEPIEMNVIE